MTIDRTAGRRDLAKVPFTDLVSAAGEVWPAMEAEYLSCLRSASYIGGPAVTAFERDWADYCGVRNAVAVGNGTDALELVLLALGIGSGDEVVVPANTFIATPAAVVRAGASPRFADVSDETLLLTPLALKAAITPRTRAVIVVHLYGQTPDMTAIRAVADEAGIAIIEDAAQAHGAEWNGQRAGSFGIAGCFSFYPAKNLGAFGDAGAVVTSAQELADRVRMLANHGRSGSHYEHQCIGSNSRMDALQAIVLRRKLDLLEGWTERRIAAAARYSHRLGSVNVQLPRAEPYARHVYHLYVVRVGRRDQVREELMRRGIETGVHYPVPCHLQPAMKQFADGPLPVTEAAAGELLSLPFFPHITRSQIDRVCDTLRDVLPA